VSSRKLKTLLSLTCAIVVVVLLVWRVRSVFDESRSASCKNNLKLIQFALLSYQQSHGTFPPAYLCDKDGKPVNSWRAEVVPFFWYNFRPGRDDYAGGPGYDYSEPWNGPKNRTMKLEERRAYPFECPSDEHQKPAFTNYVAVVGPTTMWTGCEPVTPAADGSDNDKILVIEVINSDIRWMEPRDLTLEEALNNIQPKKGIGIGSRHGDGIHYVTVGGDVRTLDPHIDRESLRKLLVRDSAVGR
jgi:hypothetical protein